MANYSPLSRLIGNLKEEEEKNIYDDGSVWTLPEDTASSFYIPPSLASNSSRLGIGGIQGNVNNEVIDPLQNPRNQITYYTKQLEGMGQEVEKPKAWDKFLNGVSDPLTRISAISSVLPNTVAGFIDASTKNNTNEKANITNSDKYKKIKDMGFEVAEYNGIYNIIGSPKQEGFEEAQKLLKEATKENSTSILKKTVKEFKAIGSGVASGYHTATGLVTGKYSDKAVDFGRLLENNRGDENSSLAGITALVEAPGYGIAKGVGEIGKLFGGDGTSDETATNWGNIVGDIGLSLLSGGLDLNDAGKTIKALRNADKLKNISKVNKFDDALKLAKKYNSYDDYVSSLGDKASKYSDEVLEGMYNKSLDTYANDLVKDVNSGLGGLNNYEGLKIGKKVILDPEQISKISKNTTQRRLLEVGLGLYSPVGALMSNPAVDGINKVMDKSESGTALKKDVSKLFVGGKNNEWITAMKDNPEKALEYANERKQVDLAKNLSNERIQGVMETINKYSDMKETPEELSKIIEEPTTRVAREIEIEREINNPAYVSKMFSLGKEEINKQTSSIQTMQNRLKAQKEELLNTAKKDVTQNSSELVAGIDSEINNLQKRLDSINNIQSSKSLDFNEQMKKFGYEDDYTEMFDKAIRTDIEALAKEVGDRELAEAMQESANRVLDNLDKQFPGISENFTSYQKIDKNKVLSGEVYNYFNSPEEIKEFSNLTSEQGLEKAKQKLDEALGMDMKDGGKNPELNKKRIRYSTELVQKYQKEYIREELKKLGIKIKDGDEYDEMINSLEMTPADDFIQMIRSKKDYIAKSEAKSFKSKAIRNYLGTEGKSLEEDLVNIAKKRVSEGGDTYTLKHTENFKQINVSKSQTKAKSLEDFRVYKAKADNLKNSLDDKKAMGIAKQLSYADGRKASMGIYENTIDKKLKNTLKIARNLTTDDVLSYVGKREANRIAKEFVKESGIDVNYKDVADRLNLLSYKEIKQELVKVAKEQRDNIDNEYLSYVKALTDDEIELLKAQQSARKLQPQDVFGDYEMVDGEFVRKGTTQRKSATFDNFETDAKKIKRLRAEEKIRASDKGALFEKAKNETDDVLGFAERGKPFDDAAKDISPLSGKDRSKFVDDDEYERLKAKKPQEYMGNTKDDMEANKSLEKQDYYIQKLAEKNKKMYEGLIEKYGKEKGTKLFNSIRDRKSKEAKELLDKKIAENKLKKEMEKQDRLKSLQNGSEEVAVTESKIVPLTDKKPLGKSVMSKLPDDIKDMVGIKINTANGEIIIDNKLKTSELKNILSNRKYGSGEKGSKIIYTNSKYKNSDAIASYVPENDTVIINLNKLNKNQAQTILEHELGHRIFKKINEKYPDIAPSLLVKPFMDFIRNLPDAKKLDFIDIVGMTNKSNVPTKEMLDVGIVTKYLNSYVKVSKNEFKVSNEAFAELFSLYNNKNLRVSSKMKKLNEDAYESFMFRLDELPNEEVKNVSKLVRKRFGDDLANQIIELKNKRDSVIELGKKLDEAAKINQVMKQASDINKTNVEIDNLEKELKDFELSMDKHEFDDDGNIISTDYDTFFNSLKDRNPEKIAEIESIVPKYKKVKSMEEKIFEIDNTKDLSPEARAYMEEYKNYMKDIAIREGIYEPEEAENYMTYVMHMINPKYSDDAEVIEKGRMLKAELEDPFNVHELSRKKQGTIAQINNEQENRIGKRIFEENINRILLKRAMDSEKVMTSKLQKERLLEQFSIPIVSNFDNHVNSLDHFMEFYGEEVKEKLGVTTKELRSLYKESEKTSFNFLKEIYFDEFKTTLPDLKSFKNVKQFSQYLAEQKYEGFYKGKMISAFKNGNIKTIEDLMFENRFPMTNKFNYARSLRQKYGYTEHYKEPLKNIPLKTEDGRPYVYEAKKDLDGNKIESKVDRTKEMPYDIEGKVTDSTDEIRAYTEFIYKEAKNRNMIIVELPKEKPETVMKRTISNKSMEKAVKDRTSLAEKISAMMTGDKEAIEGFDALAGYTVIDPSNIKFEELNLDSGTKKILIDRNAWENYQKAIKDTEYKQKNALVKIYDYFNTMFKSQALFSVGFHARNSVQNVIASYIKTGANLLDPKKNKEALDMLLYKNNKVKNLDVTYNGYNVDEILREAERNGIFETQVKNEFEKEKTKEFLEGKTDKLEVKKYSIGESINPFSTNFIGYRGSQKVGGVIEEQAKMVNIITHLENGMNLSDAIKLTKDTLFDYSDLTQFESKVMKRAFPFYTFIRKNIPSQLDNFSNHTARVGRIERIYRKASENNETDKERALRPDYLDGQLALGNQKYINLGNATDDLKKLTNPLEMGSSLNPLIKTPIELIFNKQMSTDKDISKYDKPTEKLKYTIESNIPVTKQISALHKLITGTDKEKEKSTKTLTKVVGNMVSTYDIETQEKATMYEYIEQLQNQYYEYLEKNPGAKEELEKEKNKTKNPEYVSPLKKLIKK